MGLKRTILLVEDDPDIRELIAEILQNQGYSVATAQTGKKAIEHLETTEELPGLILLDLMMPVMNGYEFREHQLKLPLLSKIPTVAVSASRLSVEDLSRLRMSECMKKPVELQHLLDVASKYCEASTRGGAEIPTNRAF